MHSHFFRQKWSLRNTLAVFPFEYLCCFLCPPVPTTRNMDSVLWFVHEGRPSLHALGLFRDLPISLKVGILTPTLEAAGREYYEFRAALMVQNSEGLTKTYNRFHDPDERSPEIVELRKLHAAMDRAVLHAYGWDDIATDCEFLLDYEIDDNEWGNKRKPWRYRWPDGVRDEVLARLMALNGKRALEERLAGRNSQLTKATS